MAASGSEPGGAVRVELASPPRDSAASGAGDVSPNVNAGESTRGAFSALERAPASSTSAVSFAEPTSRAFHRSAPVMEKLGFLRTWEVWFNGVAR